MILRLSLFFCINFFLVPAGAAIFSASGSIKLLKKGAAVVPPGIVNIPFFIESNSTEIFQPYIKILKPDAWDLLTATYPLELQPGDKMLSLVSMRIPPAFPVGSYNIEIQLYDKKDSSLLDNGKIEITVQEVEQITIRTVAVPGNIFAGDTCKAVYIMQNDGNTEKKIFLETTGCTIDGDNEFLIPPGGSKRVSVFKITSPEIFNAVREVLSIRALVGGEVYQNISSPVTIFPVKAEKQDLYLRFPVNFSMTGLAVSRNNTFQTAPQIELSGSGPIDADGRHKISFLARGPDNTNMGFLGSYDQYNFSYSAQNIRVSLGERSYSFTPLTESSRFGTGVENTVVLNNGLSFGFLFIKPRFYEEISNEMAIYSLFEKNNNSTGLYYVQKKSSADGSFARLASLTASFRPFERTMAGFELSRGYWKGIADNAYRASISTNFSLFRFAGNYNYTGRDYPGYYSNSTFYSGSLSAQITSGLSTGMHLRRDFVNARLDTFFTTAPYTSSCQTFLNYTVSPRSNMRLYWRNYERKDRLLLEKFHYKTQSLNSQFNHKLNRLSYILTGEFGETTNYLIGNSGSKLDTYRGTASFTYNFNFENTLRLFGSWSNINSFVSDNQRNLTAGISVRSRILKNLQVNLHIQNGYDIDDYYKNRNLINLFLDYNFLKKHLLSLKSYYMLFRGETQNPEMFVSFTYNYKIGISLKKISEAGDIKGRLLNRDDKPVPGVVLSMMNKKTITDKNGVFWFRNIEPGIYLLSIDRSGLEVDEIPAVPLPLHVEVIEDNQTELNIMIVKGAKIEGRVSFLQSDDIAAGKYGKTLENIILEFSNDKEQFRIATGKQGEFSFPLVIPGRWTLKIFPNSVPSGYETERSTYQFDLNAGERIYIEPVLKEKTKNIIFKPGNVKLSN